MTNEQLIAEIIKRDELIWAMMRSTTPYYPAFAKDKTQDIDYLRECFKVKEQIKQSNLARKRIKALHPERMIETTPVLELNWSGFAYKHHIAFDFEHNNTPAYPNGAGKGATIFLTLEALWNYAKGDPNTRWYVAKLRLDKAPLRFEFDNPNMATILVDWEAEEPGFVPLEVALSGVSESDRKLFAAEFYPQFNAPIKRVTYKYAKLKPGGDPSNRDDWYYED